MGLKERSDKLEERAARLQSKEMKEFTKNQYTTHMKLILTGILFIFFGFIFKPLLLVALVLLISGGVCMGMNWNRISMEQKQRKNIK